VTEKAKTKEQQDLEKHLAALREEEEKLIVRQKMNDNALLLTFHSKEDLYAGLKIKMQYFDNQATVLEGSLKNANKQLQDQQNRQQAMSVMGKKYRKNYLRI